MILGCVQLTMESYQYNTEWASRIKTQNPHVFKVRRHRRQTLYVLTMYLIVWAFLCFTFQAPWLCLSTQNTETLSVSRISSGCHKSSLSTCFWLFRCLLRFWPPISRFLSSSVLYHTSFSFPQSIAPRFWTSAYIFILPTQSHPDKPPSLSWPRCSLTKTNLIAVFLSLPGWLTSVYKEEEVYVLFHGCTDTLWKATMSIKRYGAQAGQKPWLQRQFKSDSFSLSLIQVPFYWYLQSVYTRNSTQNCMESSCLLRTLQAWTL